MSWIAGCIESDGQQEQVHSIDVVNDTFLFETSTPYISI